MSWRAACVSRPRPPCADAGAKRKQELGTNCRGRAPENLAKIPQENPTRRVYALAESPHSFYLLPGTLVNRPQKGKSTWNCQVGRKPIATPSPDNTTNSNAA